jgi:hypothetical protein
MDMGTGTHSSDTRPLDTFKSSRERLTDHHSAARHH